MRKPAVATRVSPTVNRAIRQQVKALGITISEYLRKLILDDLESKRVFNSQFSKTFEQTETKKTETPADKLRRELLKPDEVDDDESSW